MSQNQQPETPVSELPQELSCYLLLIQDLLNEKGYVRGVELAERLQMSRPTVTRAMQRLAALGYAFYERYRGLTLTPAGVEAAKKARVRFEAIYNFLLLTDAKLSNPQLEARRLESYASEELVNAFRLAANKLSK